MTEPNSVPPGADPSLSESLGAQVVRLDTLNAQYEDQLVRESLNQKTSRLKEINIKVANLVSEIAILREKIPSDPSPKGALGSILAEKVRTAGREREGGEEKD